MIRGRDVESGLPKSVKVHSVGFARRWRRLSQRILSAITETLEETPPELVSDIMRSGIVLAGGSSQLRGLEKLVNEETTMPVWTTPEPDLAVVRGCAAVLDRPALLKRTQVVGGMR